jgi:hypothetical protein
MGFSLQCGSCGFLLDKSTHIGKPVLYVRDFNVRSVKDACSGEKPWLIALALREKKGLAKYV